ncbi:MAG: TOBE domain-containing protein [Polaromonas sp.]|uniref:TOBE domain-containing protein n=1 Tax=Polaromonas sp. TaxID=1869339 RepID=UPI00273216AA|nr:TOBE domain-containing protein [Polaromonas sp.]MDP2258005.1 TOBE domain-containing protein [Polaromonas sp.]MDP3708881.1 TOBE domain-containing protein [Polaromonas sp.]
MKPTLQLTDALGHEVADKRLDILRRIGDVGSISEAARGAGVSYKAAWQAIDTLSNLAGAALLERTVGGAGGGGAQLTQAGRQLLQAAQLLSHARAQVFARLAARPGDAFAGAAKFAALGLRTSMRNQLPCFVTDLKPKGQAMRVELVLSDGTSLFSRITRESAELLALHPGQAVLALCKATAVDVLRAGEPVQGRNQLEGRVTRCSRAAAGGEAALALGCGLQLVGFAGPASGVKVHGAAVAYVDESAVVVALSG